jgi:hypothetical protein
VIVILTVRLRRASLDWTLSFVLNHKFGQVFSFFRENFAHYLPGPFFLGAIQVMESDFCFRLLSYAVGPLDLPIVMVNVRILQPKFSRIHILPKMSIVTNQKAYRKFHLLLPRPGLFCGGLLARASFDCR